jgi:hypothetical protein
LRNKCWEIYCPKLKLNQKERIVWKDKEHVKDGQVMGRCDRPKSMIG